MYLTGKFIDSGGQFSRERVGGLVDDYIANLRKLSTNQWTRILGRCGMQVKEDQVVPIANAPEMSRKRRTLYVASSNG